MIMKLMILCAMRREAILLSPSYSRLGIYQIYNNYMEEFQK